LPGEGPQRIRSLFEVALENAVEGCVRETYGALVAWLQAMTAGDAQVRRALRIIAAEETEHARLSLAVAELCRARLSPADLRIIKNAELAAALQLAAEVEKEPEPSLARLAGLPSRSVARRIVTSAQQLLWSA
jgi:rubrerythrin